MQKILFASLVFLFVHTSAHAEEKACAWCVQNDKNAIQEIKSLAELEPAKRLQSIRDKGICISILDSDRPVPPGFFHWGSVEKPQAKLLSATKLKNVMGKTLCKGETEFSKKCPTIIIASDAPASTLLHEFLHYRQLEKDKSWCPLSKKLWGKKPSADEEKIIRDKEWDVHKALWENREKLKFNLEDRVAVLSETFEEAQARRSYDPSAFEYIKQKKIDAELNAAIDEYKAKLGIRRK